MIAVSLQSWHSQLTLYARKKPSAVFGAPPDDEQLTLCRPKCSKALLLSYTFKCLLKKGSLSAHAVGF
jgi:hypothetical protein